MAYLSKQVFVDSDITLMSTDKYFLQLVDDRISGWSPTKKVMYNPDKVLEDYGIPSHNFLLYRVLDGDKSDSVPGVKGAGIKTTREQLQLASAREAAESMYESVGYMHKEYRFGNPTPPKEKKE